MGGNGETSRRKEIGSVVLGAASSLCLDAVSDAGPLLKLAVAGVLAVVYWLITRKRRHPAKEAA